MSWRSLKDLSFGSMLELGCNEGVVYRHLEPREYLGVDLEPRFAVDAPHEVVKADVFSWTPPEGRKFDLVFCDAHDGVDSPKLFTVTARQLEIAKRVSLRWIAVDDCWVDEICRASVMALGSPKFVSMEDTCTWIWEIAK